MKAFLTDENFKHEINFDNDLLPYKIYQTTIANGYPDTLFHWHPELEISYIYEGTAQYHIDYDYFNSQTDDIILGPSQWYAFYSPYQKIKCKSSDTTFSI